MIPSVGYFLGLLRRTVQNLHSAGGDFDCVVVVKLVPVLEGNVWPRNAFGHEVFHLFEQGVGLRGFVDQAFEDIARYGLAIVVVGSHDLAIHHMRREDMDVVPIGWCAGFLLGRSAPRTQSEYSRNQKGGKESILVVQSFSS